MQKLKISVGVILFLFIEEAASAGFVTLPTSGSSTYVQCRIAGDFGFLPDSTVPPLADSSCVAPNGVSTTLSATSFPESGFTLQSSVSGMITAFSESLGILTEIVFKNAGTCIYEKQVVMSSMTSHDYHPQLAGTQRIEVNDFAFGGYTGNVSVGYAKAVASYPSVYRIGRTFTSVQKQNASGYLILPTSGGVVATEINGVGQTFSPVSPTAAQQEAPFSASWIDFTTRVTSGIDQSGVAYPSSPNMYIKQACVTAMTAPVANSFKLRQTGRLTQPWVVITSTSRAPSTNIAP